MQCHKQTDQEEPK